MRCTRRGFAIAGLAGLWSRGMSGGVDSTFHGVRIGVQSASFTFSGLGLDDILPVMVEVGLGEADVMSEHVENYLGAPVALPGAGRRGPWERPAEGGGFRPGATAPVRASVPQRGPDPAAREALRRWRLTAPLEGFRRVREKFERAGVSLFSYNLSFRDDFTDEEIDRGFQMALALGTKIITASSPVSVFPRLAPFAERYGVRVALHNHTNGPEEFAQVMALSGRFWVNLDVGHFFASGHDPLAYVKQYHGRITNIHLKDRKRNNGPEMEFGRGDTPLKEVLQLLKKERYGFPAQIEYVGPAGPRVELARCLEFCKAALE